MEKYSGVPCDGWMVGVAQRCSGLHRVAGWSCSELGGDLAAAVSWHDDGFRQFRQWHLHRRCNKISINKYIWQNDENLFKGGLVGGNEYKAGDALPSGGEKTKYTNDIFKFDIDAEKWVQFTKMKHYRRYHAMSAVSVDLAAFCVQPKTSGR